MRNFAKMLILAAVVGFTACTADTTPTEPVEIPEVLEEWDSENAENAENPAPTTQTELISIEENPRNPLRFLGDDNQHAWRFNENGEPVLYRIKGDKMAVVATFTHDMFAPFFADWAVDAGFHVEERHILDFGLLDDWIIVVVGNFQGSANIFYGSFIRLKEDGSQLEHFFPTRDARFWIADGWLYYNFWEIQDASPPTVRRMRADGSGQEDLDGVTNIATMRNGYIYGEIFGDDFVDFVRFNPNNGEIITLFAGDNDSLPKIEYSHVRYHVVEFFENYIQFRANVWGFREFLHPWRSWILYSALFQVDENGENLELLEEWWDEEFLMFEGLAAENSEIAENLAEENFATIETETPPQSPWERIADGTAEYRTVDYILMTNADNTLPHEKIRETETFLGITLEQILRSGAIYENGEFEAQVDVEAVFSGQLRLGGDLLIFDNMARGRLTTWFTVSEPYFAITPVPAVFDQIQHGIVAGRMFEFDTEKTLNLLGFDDAKIARLMQRPFWEEDFDDWVSLKFHDVSVVLDGFILMYLPTDSGNLANIVELSLP